MPRIWPIALNRRHRHSRRKGLPLPKGCRLRAHRLSSGRRIRQRGQRPSRQLAPRRRQKSGRCGAGRLSWSLDGKRESDILQLSGCTLTARCLGLSSAVSPRHFSARLCGQPRIRQMQAAVRHAPVLGANRCSLLRFGLLGDRQLSAADSLRRNSRTRSSYCSPESASKNCSSVLRPAPSSKKRSRRTTSSAASSASRKRLWAA